jgi:heat shock protein 4
MSVFGVDFGTLSSVIAVTRHGGIDIICNEVSKRDTASVISFLGNERLIGESGFDRAVRNANNTVPGFKRYIGAQADLERLNHDNRFLFCGTDKDAEGKLKFEVNYKDETETFYPEQILAMFIGKLRKYVALETKSDARDCVVSVPAWYTCDQRQKVIQACEMAGVTCLSVINETTAAAVDYGIFRGSSLPETEETAQTVAVVDVGYAGTTVSISKFWKSNMRVLAHAWDTELGCREMDYMLFQHFAKEILKKHKIDVMENKRARIRLLQACEKTKTMLSGNAVAPMSIENLMDIDVFMQFNRDDFEAVIEPLKLKLAHLCEEAMKKAGISKADVDVIEIIGGGSRIPAVKAAIQDGFDKVPNFTLNATESIAKGCAITAAVFSPMFQVREYVVNETPLCPIMLGYHSETATALSEVSFLPNVNKVVSIAKAKDSFPKTLELTFDRKDAFDVCAFYDETADAAKYCGKQLLLGEWTVGTTDKPTTGGVKVRIKLAASGIVNVESASTSETYEVEVAVELSKEATQEERDAPPKMTKVIKTRKLTLSVTPKTAVIGHAAELVVAGKKKEADMDASDMLIVRTKEVRNELESFVYDNRSRVADGDLKEFVTVENGAKFVSQANEIEEWLYNDGSDAVVADYQSRLDTLKVIGAAAIQRQRTSEELPFEHKQFEAKMKPLKLSALAKVHAPVEHITEEELNVVIAKCDAALEWAATKINEYTAQPKHEDAKIATANFGAKFLECEIAVKTVIYKKAPANPQEEAQPKEEAKKEEAKKEEAPAADAAAPAEPSQPEVDMEMD